MPLGHMLVVIIEIMAVNSLCSWNSRTSTALVGSQNKTELSAKWLGLITGELNWIGWVEPTKYILETA